MADRRVENLTESVYLKLLTRIGTPAMIALISYFGNSELQKITDGLETIPKILSEQAILEYKVDQLVRDLSATQKEAYTKEEAQKDLVVQNTRDSAQDEQIKALGDRAQNLGIRVESLEKRVLK